MPKHGRRWPKLSGLQLMSRKRVIARLGQPQNRVPSECVQACCARSPTGVVLSVDHMDVLVMGPMSMRIVACIKEAKR